MIFLSSCLGCSVMGTFHLNCCILNWLSINSWTDFSLNISLFPNLAPSIYPFFHNSRTYLPLGSSHPRIWQTSFKLSNLSITPFYLDILVGVGLQCCFVRKEEHEPKGGHKPTLIKMSRNYLRPSLVDGSQNCYHLLTVWVKKLAAQNFQLARFDINQFAKLE